MKKILSILTIITLFGVYTPVVEAENDNYFVVTAYYSPLPNQEYYITGDYKKELILNGQGIAGASGRKVYSGMLAAPGKYSFGTKIYLDGLGIGSVDDRGGAIVPAGQRGYSYDRIDVWMGYGDEGLRRANFWGKRTIYGYVVDSGNATTINYKNVPAPGWAITGLKKAGSATTIHVPINTPVIPEVVQPSVFDISLGKGSDSESISKMQDIFSELGYMSREYSEGKYDTATIENIIDFQLQHELITDSYEVGAGSYGPKTRKKLQELYDIYIAEKAEQEAFLEKLDELEQESKQDAEKYTESLGIPTYGGISPATRELQKSLKKLGFFEYKDTAIFGVKTKNSLIEYQLSKDIISDSLESGAGVFGPKTREQFTSDMGELYFINLLKEQEIYNKYQELEDSKKDEEEQELEEILQNIFEESTSLI